MSIIASAMARADVLEEIERDVAAALDHPARGCAPAEERLLERLGATPTPQAREALHDILSASQHVLARAIYGGKGA